MLMFYCLSTHQMCSLSWYEISLQKRPYRDHTWKQFLNFRPKTWHKRGRKADRTRNQTVCHSTCSGLWNDHCGPAILHWRHWRTLLAPLFAMWRRNIWGCLSFGCLRFLPLDRISWWWIPSHCYIRWLPPVVNRLHFCKENKIWLVILAKNYLVFLQTELGFVSRFITSKSFINPFDWLNLVYRE